MTTELITVIGTLGGAFVGTFGTYLVTWISKKYEYKKDYRRLIVEVATKEWKEALELALKTPGRTNIMPLFSFMIFASEMLDLLEKKKTDRSDVKKVLNKAREVEQIVKEYDKEVQQGNHL